MVLIDSRSFKVFLDLAMSDFSVRVDSLLRDSEYSYTMEESVPI
jgi:hypothetical protein